MRRCRIFVHVGVGAKYSSSFGSPEKTLWTRRKPEKTDTPLKSDILILNQKINLGFERIEMRNELTGIEGGLTSRSGKPKCQVRPPRELVLHATASPPLGCDTKYRRQFVPKFAAFPPIPSVQLFLALRTDDGRLRLTRAAD